MGWAGIFTNFLLHASFSVYSFSADKKLPISIFLLIRFFRFVQETSLFIEWIKIDYCSNDTNSKLKGLEHFHFYSVISIFIFIFISCNSIVFLLLVIHGLANFLLFFSFWIRNGSIWYMFFFDRWKPRVPSRWSVYGVFMFFLHKKYLCFVINVGCHVQKAIWRGA